jgi:NADH dehydrogenase [ubiquinone] 1 alpha subcomplex assembly factor 5
MLTRLSTRPPRLRPSSFFFTRSLASSPLSPMTVFNTEAKFRQRERAAAATNSREFDYLRDELARRLVERLDDVTRTFPLAVDLGANSGNILAALRASPSHAHGIQTLHMIDSSPGMLYRDKATWSDLLVDAAKGRSEAGRGGHRAAADDDPSDQPVPGPTRVVPHVQPLEGRPLPFEDASVDLCLSSCSLHWINNLPSVFNEARRILRPDRPFLGAILGGETLCELRDAFYAAEMALDGGVSPHVSPMAGPGDVGALLSSAGFALQTVDVDTFTIEYPSASALMRHLRAMGEGNAALGARGGARRRLLARVEQEYGQGQPVEATFQAVFFIGWTPSKAQPQPLARGSVPKGFGMRKKEEGGHAQ